MKIGVDVMGGDFAPDAIIEGAVDSLQHLSADDELVLIGNEKSSYFPMKKQGWAWHPQGIGSQQTIEPSSPSRISQDERIPEILGCDDVFAVIVAKHGEADEDVGKQPEVVHQGWEEEIKEPDEVVLRGCLGAEGVLLDSVANLGGPGTRWFLNVIQKFINFLALQ